MSHFTNANPLFVKYISEGNNPTTYIPPEKRRQIYDYMQKSNMVARSSWSKYR
jgi:hypothetical protein